MTNEIKKYKLDTTDVKEVFGRKLFRVVAITSFLTVSAGDKGGYIESEKNLSHYGNAWVSENAEVYGNAEVSGNAEVYGNARVYGNAWVSENAEVYGNARVSENAWASGNARVYGDAEVYGNAWASGNARVYGDAEVFGDARVSENAWVYGDAEVFGDARVSGNAWVSENARVSENAEVMWVTKIGSSLSTLTVFRTKEGYNLARGCFLGNMEEFKKAVAKKSDTDDSKKEYEMLIPLIEYRFNKYLEG